MEGNFTHRAGDRPVPPAVLSSVLLLVLAVLIGVWSAPSLHAQAVTPLSKNSLLVAGTSSGPGAMGISALDEECTAANGVCLYTDQAYGGAWVRFEGTGCYADFTQIGFNDLASSLRFGGTYGGGRYQAVLYEHAYYGGVYSAFNADDADFGNDAIGHDRASSICVNPVNVVPECSGDGVYLYEHTNYGGACRKFTGSVDNLTSTGFNDITSSVRLAGSYGGGSYRVTLCEHAGFTGACSTFTGDDPDLTNDAVGNDRTSSVSIQPNTGSCPTITAWKGEYWNNKSLAGSPILCRNDANVTFNWAAGGPGSGVPNDTFSARWTRNLAFAAGRYRFHLRGDDGIRLWVDNSLIIDQWRDQSSTEYTVDRDLTAGSHSLRVEYYENAGDANVALWWDQLSSACPMYKAEYFNNRGLTNPPAYTVCENWPIDHSWGSGGPGNGIGNDNFSVRWTGRPQLSAGTYMFTARSDDGIRVWLNGSLLIDGWRDQAATEYRQTRTLGDGYYDIRVEYYENAGDAVAQFWWQQTSASSGVVISNKPAFDTCRLPLTYEMQNWWNYSPYYEANVYLGGVNRACNDWNRQHLTASWVQAVHAQGWNFIPTWAGPQAPCGTSGALGRMSSDANMAYNQGRAEADAAVNAARTVGLTTLGSGKTVIYYTIAPYPNNSACRNTVKSFMSGWVGRLHELGMRAGGYGASCGSYVSDWANISNVPDDIWAATANWPAYDPNVTVWNVGSCVSSTLWINHQRIFQYTLGHNESWGSTTLNIDSDIADGEVGGAHPRLSEAAPNGSAGTGATGPELLAAHLITPDQGWVLTRSKLLWSADRGDSWNEITPAGAGDVTMRAAEFIDPLHGWLIFSANGDSDSIGLMIARTVDGGRSWSVAPVSPAPIEGGSGLGNPSLSFVDASTGWLSVQLASSSSFSLGALFVTHDGGETWMPLSIPIAGQIRFTSPTTGWLAGGSAGDELYVTRDGGNTWGSATGLPRTAPGSGVFLYDLPSFQSGSEGVIPVTISDPAQPRVEFYRTQDGGASWELASRVPLQRQPATAVGTAIAAGNTWLAVDPASGEVQVAETGGKSYRSVLRAGLPDGAQLDFVTPNIGWALRRYGSCTGDKTAPTADRPFVCAQHTELMRTTNRGASWEVLKP